MVNSLLEEVSMAVTTKLIILLQVVISVIITNNFGQHLRLPLQMAITVQEVLAQTKLVVGLQQLDGNSIRIFN